MYTIFNFQIILHIVNFDPATPMLTLHVNTGVEIRRTNILLGFPVDVRSTNI